MVKLSDRDLILLYLYACGSKGSRSLQHLTAALHFIKRALRGE